jgi:hypothetical protein
MISKLRSVPLTIAPETQPNSNDIKPPKSPEPSRGVAETTDSFESANPLQTGIFEGVQFDGNYQQALDRVSDKLNNISTKTELKKSEEQDSEIRLRKGYTSIGDLLKEMRK